MFCPECGSENPDNAKFCGNCRHQFAAKYDPSSDNDSQKIVNISDDQEGGQVSDLMKYGVLAGTVLIPFIGVVMGIIYLAQGESEEKKSVGKLWLIGGVVMMVIWFMFYEDY